MTEYSQVLKQKLLNNPILLFLCQFSTLKIFFANQEDCFYYTQQPISAKIKFSKDYKNFSNEFSFQKLEDLCKQNEDELTIHTIGTVLYSANKIDLKNLNGDQIISLNIQCKRVPENGMHIHLFGVSKNYMPTDCVKHQKVTVIDLHFWNDLEIYQYAKELEQFLYQIN